jgi:hypothetical protein
MLVKQKMLLKKGLLRVRRWMKPRRLQVIFGVSFFVTLIAAYSYVTNPFVKFSVISDPHSVIELTEDGQITLSYDESIILRSDPFFNQLARLKSTWHIISSRFSTPKLAQSRNVDEIITEIHDLRFNPELPYIISGDHFSVLYPRSLGIFYHSLLDSRTALSQKDWLRRQVIYAKTLAYALEVYAQSDKLSTTIVPIGPRSVALFHVYATPSDTLYSLLFALERLQSQEYFQEVYPFANDEILPEYAVRELGTQKIATELLEQHRENLVRHFNTYMDYIYDKETGLVKTDIRLSSTKDIVWREGAFYDNIIAWKTHQLAQSLGLIDQDQEFLDEYKARILDTFWFADSGLFIEDLSEQARTEKWYSGDWLIAYQTGFLNPSVPEDLEYLEAAVAYIRRNAIDQPFAMQFHPDRRPERLYWIVRLAAPDYGSTTIWSNWGMEYAKLLLRLSQETGNATYLSVAQRQLDAYTLNIKRYRGYPELYNYQGELYKTPLYRSILRTGWVVTYEQFRAMMKVHEKATLDHNTQDTQKTINTQNTLNSQKTPNSLNM